MSLIYIPSIASEPTCEDWRLKKLDKLVNLNEHIYGHF